MEKGFTLVELLAVITIMSLLLGLVVTNLAGSLNKLEDVNYENLSDRLESAAKLYNQSENVTELTAVGGVVCITLQAISDKALIVLPIENPRTGSDFSPTTCVNAHKISENIITYELDN